MPKKGEVWLASLSPTKGQEQSGTRPVVVISGNAMNDNFSLAIVCPLTTSIKNFHGALILNPNNENKLTAISEVLTIHIKSISQQRLIKKIGDISKPELDIIFDNLNKIFKY